MSPPATTIQRRETIDADVVHVELELADSSYPFIALSTTGNCEVELEEMLPRKTGGYKGFYTIRDGDPERLLQRATTFEESDPQFIHRSEDGGLLELNVSEACPGMFLAEQGAFPRRVSATAGVGRIVAELLTESSEPDAIDAFFTEYPTAELLTHRQKSYHTPLFSHRGFEQAIEELLTDRQQEVLQTAHESGYYKWPRETTGEQLSAQLGISPATLHQHLRTAEQKLVTLLFD